MPREDKTAAIQRTACDDRSSRPSRSVPHA